MAKCSCAIDEIAKRMSYKEYAQAEAIARLWKGQVLERKLKVLVYQRNHDETLKTQAASELECFNFE